MPVFAGSLRQMDDMTERYDQDEGRGSGAGRRYWWVTALLAGVLVLTLFNMVSTVATMQFRADRFEPFLECVERSGGTYTQPDQWVKAGGRPIVIASEPLTDEDAEIHAVCWEQVNYVGP